MLLGRRPQRADSQCEQPHTQDQGAAEGKIDERTWLSIRGKKNGVEWLQWEQRGGRRFAIRQIIWLIRKRSTRVLDFLQKGDILVVTRIDRLARSRPFPYTP
jgi:DNA invertase Pin-like site-specific DNA recombinase